MAKVWSIGRFAKLVGASISSLKRWDRAGVLKAARWPNGRRYYTEAHQRAVLVKRPHFAEDGVEVIGVVRFAELTGVSISTIKRWSRSGKLVPMRAGRRVYYTQAQLQLVLGWKGVS